MSRILLLVALAAVLAAPARGQALPPGADRDAGRTVLHLAETADRSVRRDRLRAELRAEAAGPEARRVQAEINRRVAAAVERAKAVPSLRVETGAYGVWQERPQNAPTRWRASQSLILVGRDAGELLGLAGDLQGDGFLLGGVGYELSQETARAAEDELTGTALTRLRERAERIAAGLGLTVVRIRDLRVGNAAADRPRPPMPMLRQAAGADAAAPPVAEPGDATVQVTVDAEILLEPGESADPRRP